MNIESILLIEPKGVENFYPFSVLHSIWEIRCGALRLFEKAGKIFPDTKINYCGRADHDKSFLARSEIQNNLKFKHDLLILDARIIANKTFRNEIVGSYSRHVKDNGCSASTLFLFENEVIAVYVEKKMIPGINELLDTKEYIDLQDEYFSDFDKIELKNINKLNYLWDAIYLNGSEISNDVNYFSQEYSTIDRLNFNGVFAINEKDIFVGKNCTISPGTVIDAKKGPVIIGDNVEIMPQSTLIGPCYIGDNSKLKIGSKIYGECSFGEHCKVGGEIENTIIQSFSNKQHEGFLGHSYLCEWVNLGADTNNSDLKNTYGNISILIENEEIDTGRMFLGLLCGDHTKTAINTSFTTGTVTGICGIFVYEGFHPRFVPSFSWGGRKQSPKYKVSKALEIVKIVMARRGKQLLPEEEKLIIDEYDRISSK